MTVMTTLRGRLIGAAVLAAMILTVAVPAAQADSAPVYLSPNITSFSSVDTQLTRFLVGVSCPSDPNLGAPCPVTVSLAWHPYNVRSNGSAGPTVSLASTTVTLNPGQSTTLTISVDPKQLRDITARRHVGATVYAIAVDNRTGQKVAQLQYSAPVGAFDTCPGPAYVPFTGGPLTVLDRDYTGKTIRRPVISGEIGTGEPLVVGNAPVTFKVLGVTYVVSPHARFDRTCWGLTDYHHGQAAPTVVLDAGRVHVFGKPRRPQIWVGVGTPQGNLGSRSQERVDFTVTTDPRKLISVMRVTVGKTTQVTPFNTPTRSPCTNGQALSVDRFGHIRRI